MGDRDLLDPPTEDTFHILISTDNHLGVHDSNPCRENDSFDTFEEILNIGKQEGVDFVLLGGDLFHENKPKPSTFQRTVDILQKHCLGPRPVSFEYLGDPKLDFHGQQEPCVNYYNPNMNIDLPVFTIHGNHDDPIGLKKTSVIDHLAAANLLNHFGTVSDLTNIEIRPVLLRKGSTFLALYGLGNMKDQRLYRLMKDNKVKFLRPEEDPDKWLNIFVIHQNRVKHGATNYIPENFIPGFIDLVVWGHEHECRPEADQLNNTTESDTKCTMVLQPGSSVATQLQPGEAEAKHALILTVHKRNFKLDKFPLKSVRPFVIDNVLVQDILKGKPKNVAVEKAVEAYLETRINQLMRDASDMLTGHQHQPIEPLIRVRLLHQDDIGNFNHIRFSQKYVDRIANEDVIILSKMSTRKGDAGTEDMDVGDIHDMIMESEEFVDLGSHVEEIVERHFRDERARGEYGNFLHILSERGISEAVRSAAEKDDQGAIKLIIESQIEKTVAHLESKNVTEETIEDEIVAYRDSRYINSDRELEEVRKALAERGPGRRPTQRADGGSFGSDEEEEIMAVDESDEERSPQATAGPSARGRGRGARGRGRGSRGGAAAGDASTPTPPRGRGRGRARGASSPAAAPRGRGRGAQVTLPVKVKNRGHSRSVQQFDDDNDSDF